MPATLTITRLLQQAIANLSSESARLDAELLLAYVLNCTPTYLHTWPETTPTAEQITEFQQLLSERKQGKPVAQLVGKQDFWSLTFKVNEHTLIPRPDTECLVEYLLDKTDHNRLTLLDAGTGTGAIALSLAKERPDWIIMASDISTEALSVAMHNAKQLQLPVSFFQGNWLEAMQPGSLDILISNPPYIAPEDTHLAALAYEPQGALIAEKNGLMAIETLCRQAKTVLKPEGFLIIEHGYNQAKKVQQLFTESGYQQIETHRDYGNNDRFTTGFTSPGQ